MAKELFTTYTEVDPNNRIGATADRVSWVALTRGEDAYVYYDFGASYFDGDFVHILTTCISDFTAPSGQATNISICWALANSASSWQDIDDANGDGLFLVHRVDETSDRCYFVLQELDGGNVTQDQSNILTKGAVYYPKVVRDEAVGTHGTLYCYIYSNAARTTLVDTLTVTLNTSKKDFRYLYAMQSLGSAAAGFDEDGYTEDLTIEGGEASVTPEVVTKQCTSITTTTATGNGRITALGHSSVTAHGHCWATTVDPTTADSKVDNGAGSVGEFTSAITGLTPGTTYYTRAYATNSYGTSYGANMKFTAGDPSSQKDPKAIGITDDELHFIGTDGKEYKLTGTAV